MTPGCVPASAVVVTCRRITAYHPSEPLTASSPIEAFIRRLGVDIRK
jgi:hypothetical protein